MRRSPRPGEAGGAIAYLALRRQLDPLEAVGAE